MKKWVPVLAILLGVVLLIIAVVLPSGSEGSGFVGIMKMIPEDLGAFAFIDADMLKSDANMTSTWDEIKSNLLGEDIYGENVSKVSGFGMAGSNYEVILYTGEFDPEQMASVIEEGSMESLEYEGTTIWTDQYDSSTAFIDGILFIGSREDIKLCIDAAGGRGASLYDNGDSKDIIGRLHDGYMLSVMIMGEDFNSGDTYGILAVGMSAWRQGGNISQASLLKFEDSEAVQEYITLLEDEGMTEDYDVVQDGRYLTISSMREIPGPEENAYNSMRDDLQSAVVAYYYNHVGTFPTINASVNISSYESQILDICALLASAGGNLSEMPEGVASLDGSDNDNCDAGCAGCSTGNHYVWAINDYGIYSTCVGDGCEANGEDGFQGVWP